MLQDDKINKNINVGRVRGEDGIWALGKNIHSIDIHLRNSAEHA